MWGEIKSLIFQTQLTLGLDELSVGREKRREGVIPRKSKKEPLDYGFGSNNREKPGGEMQTEMQ